MATCIAISVMIIFGLTAVFCIPDTMRAIQNGQFKPVLFGISSGIVLAALIYLAMAFMRAVIDPTGLTPFLR